MRIILLLLCLFSNLAVASQPIPRFSDIARNADGSIRQMNQDEAISYCAKRWQRLPSIREFAELATSMGATGISETAKSGFYEVNGRNADGKVDRFYFSNSGYNRPPGDLGTNWFWSSSVYLSFPYGAFNLYGSNGAVGFIYLGKLGAVRCAINQ